MTAKNWLLRSAVCGLAFLGIAATNAGDGRKDVPEYSTILKTLTDDGWKATHEPLKRGPCPVTAKLVKKDSVAYPPNTQLQFSWAVIWGPVEIGSEEQVFYSRRPKIDLKFRRDDGSVYEVSGARAWEKQTPLADGEGGLKETVRREVPDGVRQKAVLLQRRMDVVVDGKIAETLFLNSTSLICFEKFEKQKK